jgi:hypothetical protein
MKPRDLGLDHLDALETRDADPVIAVLDKVAAADLVQDHGRQVETAVERPLSTRFQRSTPALVGIKSRSNSSDRPTLPTTLDSSTTRLPR